MADQAEGPLLALSRLTRVTGIWLGGCLAAPTLGSCTPTFPSPFAPQWPHTTPFSLKQGTMQAFPDNLCPCATSRGMPCTKTLSLAHLAHVSWPPRRLVIVLLTVCEAESLLVVTMQVLSWFTTNHLYFTILRNTRENVFFFPSRRPLVSVHSLNQIRFAEHEWSFPGTRSDTLTQLLTFTPGSCPVQSQFDLLPMWGSWRLSALLRGTSVVAMKDGKLEMETHHARHETCDKLFEFQSTESRLWKLI